MNHSLYSGLTLPHSHCLWKQYHNSVVPSKLNSTNIWAPSWCFLMVDPSQTLLHSQAITSSHLCPEKMQLWSPPVPSTYLFHPPSCCLTLNRSLNFQAFFQPSDSFTNYCQHFFFFFLYTKLGNIQFFISQRQILQSGSILPTEPQVSLFQDGVRPSQPCWGSSSQPCRLESYASSYTLRLQGIPLPNAGTVQTLPILSGSSPHSPPPPSLTQTLPVYTSFYPKPPRALSQHLRRVSGYGLRKAHSWCECKPPAKPYGKSGKTEHFYTQHFVFLDLYPREPLYIKKTLLL